MLVDTKPKRFDELIRISGLSHGTDVWLGNAQTLIDEGTVTLSQAICCRDDIMIYLIKKGLPPNDSFKIMESVRKGKVAKGKEPKWEQYKELMKEHDVPVHFVNRISEKTNTIFDLMFTDTVDLVIDIPTRNDNLKDGFLIRRFAVEAGIPIYTSLDTAKALIDSLEKRKHGVPSLIDITKLR